LAGYRLALRIDPDTAHDPHHQAALLTAVALARRVFLGKAAAAQFAARCFAADGTEQARA
jgi:hypothetical protein